MPVQTGDFSASQLRTSISRADKMWSDDMMQAEFKANTGVYDAVKAEQNANVRILEEPSKDRDVKIHWINACGGKVEDNDGLCEIGGDELSSDSKEYGLKFDKKFSFNVDEYKFRTNDYSMEEVVAKGFMRADKMLSEQICKSMVARIESFKGTNVVNDGTGSVNTVSGNTDIQAADWNERLFAYLHRVAIQNEFSNGFLLSGTNMYEDRFLALSNVGNGEGKGAAKLYQSMRTYFDLFNIDPQLSPELKTYLINRGSLAFASKSIYGAVPKTYIGAGHQHYSIASRNLAGVRFDVKYTNACKEKTMMHKFTVNVKYDLFLNYTGCNEERTGVIALNKVGS